MYEYILTSYTAEQPSKINYNTTFNCGYSWPIACSVIVLSLSLLVYM